VKLFTYGPNSWSLDISGVMMTDSDDSKSKRKDRENDRKERGKRPRLTGKGRERVVHEDIIAKRLGGGALPTMDAYARGLEQWQKLPGSLVRPPTDVTLLSSAQEPIKPVKAKPSVPLSHDDTDDEEDQS